MASSLKVLSPPQVTLPCPGQTRACDSGRLQRRGRSPGQTNTRAAKPPSSPVLQTPVLRSTQPAKGFSVKHPAPPSAPLTASRRRKGPDRAPAAGAGGLPARPPARNLSPAMRPLQAKRCSQLFVFEATPPNYFHRSRMKNKTPTSSKPIS